ncbi:PilC/PilY family type IV pilus protein [Thalassolituus sp. LLYu03]|uniref:pilus assembly protein n=1 Tax=Thalassolituus sp. LLYu03 TaxID=3421656 RepID=UPI003D27926E
MSYSLMATLRPLILAPLMALLPALPALLATGFACADDTEIYTGSTNTAGDPNVIFLFDTSGSMGEEATGADGETSTRIEVSKDAAKTIISGLSNINIGIMQFDYTKTKVAPVEGQLIYRSESDQSSLDREYGGLVLVPVASINDEEQVDDVVTAISGLVAKANTPLLESYDEAARYMRGEDVKYGKRWGYVTCENKETAVESETTTTRTQVCLNYSSTSSSGPGGGPGGGPGSSYSSSAPTCSEYGSAYVQQGNGAWVLKSNQCIAWTNVTSSYSCSSYGYVETTTTINSDETTTTFTCSATTTAQDFYVSRPGSYDASTGKYISPITDSCQTNHIIVFTDGSSTKDNESDDRVHSLLSELDANDWSSLTGMSSSCTTGSSSSESCLEEMAYYLYHTDNMDDSELTSDDSTAESQQKIITHTVGGFLDDNSNSQKILNRMASYGGGVAVTASDYDSLVEALQQVFTEISSSSGTFTAPAVAVNALNRLEHSDELYYTIFEPSSTIGWAGNLKRYRLGSDGQVYDMNGNNAVDSSTGYFSDNARSYWTLDAAAPDGDSVGTGGAASRLTASRTIYTHLSTSAGTLSTTLITKSGSTYAANTGITQSLFGSSLDSDDFLSMLEWASGLDVNSDTSDTPRYEIEDPLHSRPVIIHYGVLDDGESLDSTIYFGTNSGYLHAIDSNVDNPQERFAFIPQDLLPNIYSYYQNANTLGKVYGLDGPVSYYTVDNANSGTADVQSIVDSNDEAYLFFGMRRGGRNYYALDVSDRDKPKFMWEIQGGSGDFAELGQTWSKMMPITVNPKALGLSGTTNIKALVFGGGYDEDEDETYGASGERITHDQGNAVFIVDAQSGELLWKASNSSSADLKVTGMTSGIVSDITPVDNDGDGDIDILYAADLGGRLWRFDLFSDGTQKATELADLNLGTTAGNVRFYTSPDVSYSTSSAKVGRYQIAIGSGFRAHPLDGYVTDNFYVVNDFMVSEDEDTLKDLLPDYETLARSDLADYSSYSTASTEKKTNGVYLTLYDDEEKVLSDSITASNTVYFTSYIPENTSSSATSCTANAGTGRLYSLTLDSATEDGVTLTTTELTQSGIPASPVLVFPPSDSSDSDSDTTASDDEAACTSSKAILVGSESIALDGCVKLQKTYWRIL